jgi:hypothetical protein
MLRGLLRAALSRLRFEALALGSLRREYLGQDEIREGGRGIDGKRWQAREGANGVRESGASAGGCAARR